MIHKVFIWAVLMLSVSVAVMSQSFSAMTYNVRYDNPSDGENNWHHRKATLVSQVLYHQPDILGVQEALHHMVTYLDEEMSDYDYVGVGRDDGQTKGEYTALFYKRSRFDLQSSGTFWLSETPGIPSKGWDASLERICTYAELRDRATGEVIWSFNAHFDHRGEEARVQSGQLIVEQIRQLAGTSVPVIVMGDFNAEPESAPVAPLRDFLLDTRQCEDCLVFGQEGTWNGFDPTQSADRRIDYIFGRNLTVKRYAVFSELINGRFISDHHPVFIEFVVD